MDKHSQFEEDVVTYLMGELSQGERDALEEHLLSCGACRGLLSAYRETLDAVGAAPDIEPSEGFTRRILEAARAAQRQFRQHEAQRAAAARPTSFEPVVSSPRHTVTYRFAKLIMYASVVTIVLIATSTMIHDEQPHRAAPERPAGNAGAGTEEGDMALTGSALFPPNFEDAGLPDLQELADLKIEVPPIGLHEPQTPPVEPFAPIEKLEVLRSEAPNPVYATRLDWRKKKRAMQQAAAGNRATFAAAAIRRGLWWLARNQEPDGRWSASEFAEGRREVQMSSLDARPPLSDEAVTAAALLAMLGDGHTPHRGIFKNCVDAGVRWLHARQQKSGAIGNEHEVGEQFLICHAMATAALAETYGMTGGARYLAAAQHAADYLLQHGVAITGLDQRFIIKDNVGAAAARMAALGTAQIARLTLPLDSAEVVAGTFARLSGGSGSVYAYPLESPPGAPITAGMLSLLSPTGARDKVVLAGELPRLRANPPDWSRNGQTYWLCGSVIARKAGGALWRRWNQALQATLIKHQKKTGPAMGSWDPNDPSSKLGGRVFSTALSVLALETPYR